MQRAIRTCIMRGGSSKGIFLQSKDLPPPGRLRDAVILRLFGSPDPRQIDGLGGADVLTSKLAIIGPPSVAGADVDYTFGQVSFVTDRVDYGGNCGNISSAVGPFAIDEGLLPAAALGEASRIVRVHNTNTRAILLATVPVGPSGAQVDGETSISGVPGTGAKIDLDFSATQGSVTGQLLPSGVRREVLHVAAGDDYGAEDIEATLLDAGQPTVFIAASSFGLPSDPAACAAALAASPSLLRRVERLRGAGAVRMGIVDHWEAAEIKSPYTPFVVMVGTPRENETRDLDATCVFMQRVHKAYPVTGSVATTAAALLPGTLVHDVAKEPSEALRIGHPSGVMEVQGAVQDGDSPQLTRAAISRTARRLIDGFAYVPWSVWPQDVP
mmetsp:Transcript_129471/g.335826  ORF Transcript_129471/g.335826 Transcript_129471/m.335826 type:complete len:384 (+) Transcript_129471:93-1244(+)